MLVCRNRLGLDAHSNKSYETLLPPLDKQASPVELAQPRFARLPSGPRADKPGLPSTTASNDTASNDTDLRRSRMDVLEAIEHAESDLATTLDELRNTKELLAALEQDAKRIKVEIVGLKSYAKRQGLSAAHEPNADVVPIFAAIGLIAAAGPDLSLMSRSDAVLTVMRSLPGPADRNMIHEQLVDGDRFDSIDDISLTLSGLKRSGRAEKLGQGLWQVADETAAAEVR